MANNIDREEYLSPKIDIVFKKIFSDIKNEDIIKGFVSSLTDIPYDSIQNLSIENTELLPEEYDEKLGRVDLNLIVNNKKINVEMQVASDANYAKRALFYWSKLYIKDFETGKGYDNLKETISINILDFNMFDTEDDYFSIFELYDINKKKRLTDALKIEFFELKKLVNAKDVNDDKYLWMQFLNSKTKEEFEMLATKNNEQINKAVVVLKELSGDERIRRIAELREKAEHDKASQMKTARDEGRAEGERKIIHTLLLSGMSSEVLAQRLNMTVDEINEITGKVPEDKEMEL